MSSWCWVLGVLFGVIVIGALIYYFYYSRPTVVRRAPVRVEQIVQDCSALQAQLDTQIAADRAKLDELNAALAGATEMTASQRLAFSTEIAQLNSALSDANARLAQYSALAQDASSLRMQNEQLSVDYQNALARAATAESDRAALQQQSAATTAAAQATVDAARITQAEAATPGVQYGM